MKFIFAQPVYFVEIRAKFVYEGHWVKIKVTGAKNGRKYSFPLCKTLIGIQLQKTEPWSLHAAWGF